jgi:hypothetical protein
VTAVQTVGGRFEPGDWERPACGHWSATDTARHLLVVARWYHSWLDRALAGDSSRPFDGSEIDAHNEQALAELDGMSGERAIADFADAALSYLERAEANWDVPFGYPFGVVTAGLHCGAAASEWHLHAWDLSTVGQPLHRPNDAGLLFTAAGRCVAQATGGLTGAVIGRLIPIGARLSPWQTLLKRSGRRPIRQ